MNLKNIIITLLLLFTTSSAEAQLSIGQNHPELKWQVIETAHFKVIYHQGIEVLAEEVAHVAETVYEPITNDLGVAPKGKTPIIVSDYDDESNGIATPLGHYIFIWAQSFKKYTTGRMKWLRRVVAHEFTHQVNFWGVRAFPGFWRELFALGMMPTWFIEGLAQYESEEWDIHRDMLLRVAASNHALLRPKKLSGFIGADRIDARLLYEEGHALVRYIAANYGRDKIKEIIQKYRSLPVSFNWALKRSIGVGERDLYQKWLHETTSEYMKTWTNKEKIYRIARRFPSDLQGNYGLRWSPDGQNAAVVGVEEFDEEVPRLYVFDVYKSKKKKVAGPFVNAFFSWSPDSKYIVYSKKRKAKNGSLVDDLFVVDVETGKSRPLTYSMRATDPAWSPDGKEIVYCVHQGPLSNLAIIDVNTGTSRVLTSFENWTEVSTPDWSPDGNRIVFSLFDAEGKRDIGVINTDGSGFRKLMDSFDDDRYPAWSPLGDRIAFISYRNGIPNLFLMDTDGGGVTQVTDVAGGVFNPDWKPRGDSLSIVAFEKRERVDIFTISAQRKTREAISSNLNNSHDGDSLKWKKMTVSKAMPELTTSQFLPTDRKKYPYQSLSHVGSQLMIPFLGKDDAGLQPGLLNLLADPLAKHQFLWYVTHRRRTHFMINYVNTQFLPTIDITVSKTTLDRGTFLKVNLWEQFVNCSVQLSLPFNRGQSLLSNHLLWLEGYISRRETIAAEKFSIFKPRFRPFQGWVNSLTLGYAWAYNRPDVAFSINPKTGASLGIYLRRADRRLKSDLEFTEIGANVIVRKELPFKEHVLAFRGGGVYHRGEEPIQSRIGLGRKAVRGLVDAIEGDKLFYGNLEYRWPLFRDLGLKLWILYFERLCGSFFGDFGKAWGKDFYTFVDGSEKNFSEVKLTKSVGAELRLRVYFLGKISLVVRGGYSILLPRTKKGVMYIIIGPVF